MSGVWQLCKGVRSPASKVFSLWHGVQCSSRRYLSSARYQAANSALNSLPEISAAQEAPNPYVARDHLKRALEIVSNTGDPRLVILAHGRMANVYFELGLASVERSHRVAMIDLLEEELKHGSDEATPELLSAAYNALALSCLRVGDNEHLLAAGAAAEAAGRNAISVSARLSATLNTAISRPPGSESQRVLLSAVTAGAGQHADITKSYDLPGFARYFSGLFATCDAGGPHDISALDSLRELRSRWESKNDWDLVEVECTLARQLTKRQDRRNDTERFNEAEEILSSALSRARELGSELDTCEVLLAIAELYAIMRRSLEAEGLFRRIDEHMGKLYEKRAFSVASADLFCRASSKFAELMKRLNREREAEILTAKLSDVRNLFPEVLSRPPHIPLWTVDSCIRLYDLPNPFLR